MLTTFFESVDNFQGRLKMGKRSGSPQSQEDIEKLPLRELNYWIRLAEFRIAHQNLSSSLHKAALTRLVWLEEERRRVHGIAAPNRKRH